MLPENGSIPAVRGARMPGGGGANATVSGISAESTPCLVLGRERTCWAILSAAAEASAQSARLVGGTQKPEPNMVSAAGQMASRPGRRSIFRSRNTSDESSRSSRKVTFLHPWLVCAKSRVSRKEAEGVPFKTAHRGGHQPSQADKLTLGTGEKRERRPQAQLRQMK